MADSGMDGWGADSAPPPDEVDVDPSPSVRDDQLRESRPPNRGRGTQNLHSRGSVLRPVVDLLIAYRLLVGIGLVAVVLGIVAGPLAWAIGQIPEIGWSIPYYFLLGSSMGLLPSYLLWRKISSVNGVEVFDLDPVGGDHRHVRVGYDMWENMTVLTPWGQETSTDDLQRCTINGRSGYELMDLRVPDHSEYPVAVSTWMGEADSSMLRTYKAAVVTARKRMSKKAQRNMAIEANKSEIAREAAERVTMWQIRNTEHNRVPNGDAMEGVIDDVLSDYGMGDPLTQDDVAQDQREREPEDRDDTAPDAPRDVRLNDGGMR